MRHSRFNASLYGWEATRSSRYSYVKYGGGGFEIWQYTSRTPTAMEGEVFLGDFGINAAKIKSLDVQKSYEEFNMKELNVLTSLVQNPAGEYHFFVKDLHGNLFR